MARALNRLSARTVETMTKAGRHSDGGGLYLLIGKDGSRRWTFLWKKGGRLREMGLGSVSTVPLKRARQIAAEARLAVFEGRDPIAERAETRRAQAATTFGEVADDVLAIIEKEAGSAKTLVSWKRSFAYAEPLRSKPVNQIETADILSVLSPVWQAKPETASRLRARIERVLDAAKAKGLRAGENPARLKGHLDHLLPKRSKGTVSHHKAMPYGDVPAFVERLRKAEGGAASALELLILTAARTGEIIGAAWSEFDLQAKVWTVPASRMKMKKEHRVPLCGRSLAILHTLAETKTTEFVFPGASGKKPLSNMAMDKWLRRLEIDATVHGFRSSFRDWAGDKTDFPREVIEAALAHQVGDAVEQAYRRGDAFEKRRSLMVAWDAFCGGASTANVVQMRKSRQ